MMGQTLETDPAARCSRTGQRRDRPAGVMQVFEEEYREDATFSRRSPRIKALHAATEGKLDVSAIEIGVVSIETGEFRKMERDEIQSHVDKFEKSVPSA